MFIIDSDWIPATLYDGQGSNQAYFSRSEFSKGTLIVPGKAVLCKFLKKNYRFFKRSAWFSED